MTATSADGCCTKRWFVPAVGSGGGPVGVAEGVAEDVDGVALEAELESLAEEVDGRGLEMESNMGVYRRGHADAE